MLTLFTPWRDLHDLKHKEETFECAFNVFMLEATEESRRIMDNMEYYYLSSEAANISEADASQGPVPDRAMLSTLEDEEAGLFVTSSYDTNTEVDEDTMEGALNSIYTPGDRLFAMQAMEAAATSGIFRDVTEEPPQWKAIATTATQDEVQKYAAWEDYVRTYTRSRRRRRG